MLNRDENILLEAHRREYYKKCLLCDGEKLLLYDLIEGRHIATPLTTPFTYTGKVHLYYPITCQNCGFTVFFHKNVVKKEPNETNPGDSASQN